MPKRSQSGPASTNPSEGPFIPPLDDEISGLSIATASTAGTTPDDSKGRKKKKRRHRNKDQLDEDGESGTDGFPSFLDDDAKEYANVDVSPKPQIIEGFVLATKAIGFNPLWCCKMRKGIITVALFAPILAGALCYLEYTDFPDRGVCDRAIVISGVINPHFEWVDQSKEEDFCNYLITLWTIFLGLFGGFAILAMFCILESIFVSKLRVTPGLAALFYTLALMSLIIQQVMGQKLYLTRKRWHRNEHVRLRRSVIHAIGAGLLGSLFYAFFVLSSVAYALAIRYGSVVKAEVH